MKVNGTEMLCGRCKGEIDDLPYLAHDTGEFICSVCATEADYKRCDDCGKTLYTVFDMCPSGHKILCIDCADKAFDRWLEDEATNFTL